MNRLLAVSVVLLVILPAYICAAEPPSVELADHIQKHSVVLEGNWLFTPTDSAGNPSSEPQIVSVPGNWNTIMNGPFGSGIYSLYIKVPASWAGPGAISFDDLGQIFRVKVQGREEYSSGNWYGNKTSFTSALIPIQLEYPGIQLDVEIKNVSFRIGGLFHPPKIGIFTVMSREKQISILVQAAGMGIVFFMMLYHLFLYNYSYSDKSALYMALACFFVLLRSLFDGENLVAIVIPGADWLFDYRMEYFSAYGTSLFLALFINRLYPPPAGISSRIIKILAAAAVIFGASCIFLPEYLLGKSIILLQIYIVSVLIYSLYLLIKAAAEGKTGPKLLLFGTVLLSVFVFFSFLYYSGKTRTSGMSLYGLYIFMFIQALVLSRHYGLAYLHAERLSKHLETEVKARTSELQESNEKLKKQISERRAAEERLQLLSCSDELTGLANRRQLNTVLNQSYLLFRRSHTPFSIIMMDLDHFKRVNDNYGHTTGDRVLVETAECIKKNCRDIDTVSRWGGEEFMIVLPHEEIEGAATAAERIRSALEKLDFSDGLHITASFGSASCGEAGSVENLISMADERLYKAKNSGRNRVISS